jgi:predicted enzyme related to lactoylglutathione lyase
MVTINAQYVHTNLVAKDWKRLVAFYEGVFGCVPIPPERDLSGKWIEAVTGVPGARIRGMHLRLPGYGNSGPTLEIFQYNRLADESRPAVNRQGYAHIAFAVDDVVAARNAVLAAGGGVVGDVVSMEIPGKGGVTFAYVTDPEGNVIELQRWSDQGLQDHPGQPGR